VEIPGMISFWRHHLHFGHCRIFRGSRPGEEEFETKESRGGNEDEGKTWGEARFLLAREGGAGGGEGGQ